MVKRSVEMLKKEIERLREEMKYQRGAASQYDITIKALENLHDTVREGIDFLKKLARVRPIESAPEYREEEEATPTEEELRELGIPPEYIEEE